MFAGIGGASTGAMNAGYTVALAVDMCPTALAVHAANHPHTTHVCMTLPPSPDAPPLPLPASDVEWHLHGSPPCTALSQCRTTNRDATLVADGLTLVRWYLEFALASRATTWSMEQVAVEPVLAVLREFKRRHPQQLDFAVVNFERLGVPQTRKRVLAGTPVLIRRVKRVRRRVRSVRDVVAHPRGTHVRSERLYDGRGRPDGTRRKLTKNECCRSVGKPSYTIVAYKPLRWATPHTNAPLARLTSNESAALQTFPLQYTFHHHATTAINGIGNAVPPLVMQELLAGAKSNLSAPPPSPSLMWRAPRASDVQGRCGVGP